MEIAVLLYNGLTALDAIGPYEAFATRPDTKIKFVAKEKGLIQLDSGMGYLHADYNFSEVTSSDILVIPGGGHVEQMNDQYTLNWIQQIHETSKWTTSVCTGSLILGAAGLLQQKKATCYWAFLDLLRDFGAFPTEERFVRQGKIVTAAGVSAGIDMALQLITWEWGKDAGKTTQLILEYDPQPPFDAGSPKKAPAKLVEQLKTLMKE
jgi:putative intracellular protease/amidase